MAKAVFIQNPTSIYDDRPGQAYNFPKMYLGVVEQTVGDWVVFYESRIGAFGYVGVQKVEKVVSDPTRKDWFFAILDPGSQWSFEFVVPRVDANGRPYESMLRDAEGKAFRGGANTLAVRRIPEADFAWIVSEGLREIESPESLPRKISTGDAEQSIGLHEAPAEFGHAPVLELRDRELLSRSSRDRSFARQVKRAYESRCAISGLSLTNGGGRPEVEAAHIRPVEFGGPDVISNGLALSGTIHWMFDRGLISVAEDLRILVSHNKVPKDVVGRLISPELRLRVPIYLRHQPHPDFLRFHREEVFGR